MKDLDHCQTLKDLLEQENKKAKADIQEAYSVLLEAGFSSSTLDNIDPNN